MSAWETEGERKKLEYQVRASLILEDSDKETWGLVRDTEGSFTYEKGQGELVGTWSKSPTNGCYHVSLETPVMALVDKATQRTAELVKRRQEAPLHPSSKRPSEAPPTGKVFDNLRKSLRGGV